jgi:hypothetical protein
MDITTQEIINRKLIQMEAYTVPTKGQRTASRKNNKMKYIQMGAYTVLTKARGSHLDFLCTSQGPKEKALRTYQDPK